jgi:hypothetical protein
MNRKLNDETDKAVINQETKKDTYQGEKFPGIETRLTRRLSYRGNFTILTGIPVRVKFE